MKKKLRKITVLLFMVLLFTGCAKKEEYGVPQDKLYSLNTLKINNIEDIVLFTYVSYKDVRTSVLVNVLDGKQYELKEEIPNIDVNTSKITYTENKMIISDMTNFNIYEIKVNGNKIDIINNANSEKKGAFMGYNKEKNQYFFDDWENGSLYICSELSSCETEVKYLDQQEGLLSHYFPMGETIGFFGQVEDQVNQFGYYDLKNDVWINVGDLGLGNDGVINARIMESSKYEEWILFNGNGKYSIETNENLVFEDTYFVNIKDGIIMSQDFPYIGYDTVESADGDYAILHDKMTMISIIDIEPNNLNIKRTYNLKDIIKEGTPRANIVNQANDQRIVFSNGDGLFVFDIEKNELNTLIKMDVDAY